MNEKNYPQGFFYNVKHENAPDFVLASISIRPDVFIEWLKEQKTNESGYIKLQAKMGRAQGDKPARPYVEIDTYGTDKKETKEKVEDTITADDIPS